MVAVPFIYFIILLIFVYFRNKRRFDLTCYIISIFAVSALFSILLDAFDLRSRDTSGYKISGGATFAYCGLITICLWPFIRMSNLSIKQVLPLKGEGKILKVLAWGSAIFFMIALILSWGDIISSLTSDMGQMRKDHYLIDEGGGGWLSTLPPGIKQLCVMLNIVFGVPWILQFLAFYSLTIQRLSNKYTVLLFAGTFSGLISNILAAGRSGFVFWAISLGACYLFFIPFMSRKDKKIMRNSFVIIGALFLVYMALVTISRFGDSSGGSQGSLISYAGQSFINFAYFWDTFTCPIPTLQNVVPLTYYLAGSMVGNANEIQEILSMSTGEALGVFYTYIGQIATSSNNIIAVIYCIMFAVFFGLVFKNKKALAWSIRKTFMYLLGTSVLFLGLFGHYYSDWSRTLAVILFFILFSFLKRPSTKYRSNGNRG